MEEFKHFKYTDPHDKYDKVKWDFDENVLQKIQADDGYIYLLKNRDNNKLKILQDIRYNVANVAAHIYKNIDSYPPHAQDGLRLFVYIHSESNKKQQDLAKMSSQQFNYFNRHWIISNGITSNVIYSELPTHTKFIGLNKPKERTVNKLSPPIGKDKQLRSKWRHIFF